VDEITLREANQADADAIGSLHVASWRETYAGLVPEEMLAGVSVEARTAMWSEILGDPEAVGCTAVFVAEDDGRLVGFGSRGRQRDGALADAGLSGEIGAIYVLRSRQGLGVGRALMAAMAGALSGRGCASASLWVLRENAPARAFYENLGGEVVGEKTDERSDPPLVEFAYGWRDLSRLAG
jgi:ribosomal protein S18 acetylase RimI-like enzyme